MEEDVRIIVRMAIEREAAFRFRILIQLLEMMA